MQEHFNIWKSVNITHKINRQKKKHMIISVDAVKALNKSNTHSWLKTLSKRGTEGNFLSLIKNIYKIYSLGSLTVTNWRYWKWRRLCLCGGGGIWNFSVLSSQFSCESKAALKIIVNGFDDAFLNKTLKTWSMIEIIDKLNFSMITNFCSWKDKVNNLRR